ncbi:unnamed protein product, partial [Mesorhabditis belari]|uniref:Secreted protein n=1 Tax=Mesorhabditis belari TaxID=2138241 RepID=A0AAF3EWY7_9BILA
MLTVFALLQFIVTVTTFVVLGLVICSDKENGKAPSSKQQQPLKRFRPQQPPPDIPVTGCGTNEDHTLRYVASLKEEHSDKIQHKAKAMPGTLKSIEHA